jgi:hypothetical protein
VIAVESFKAFKPKDIGAIAVLAGLLSLIIYLLDKVAFDNAIALLLTFGFFVTFTTLLIRKAGTATLFFAIVTALTLNIASFGVDGVSKIIVMILAGLVFELTFLILKIELKNIPLDVIVGAALSTASIPLLAGLVASTEIVQSLMTNFLNLIILGFVSGLAGSIIAFLLWWNIRTVKWIMKFEYE